MPPIKSNGIVLKKFDFRETSVILHLYTEKMGKIKGVLKGVRHEKSKIPPATIQIGSHIFMLIYEKKSNLHLISSPQLIKYFEMKPVKNSHVWYYILGLVDIFTQENLQEPQIYQLIVNTGELLETSENPEILLIFFKIKFTRFLGYGFYLENCISCKGKDSMYFFSGKLGGIICRKCVKKDVNSTRISYPVLKIMRLFDNLSYNKVKVIKSIPENILKKVNFYINSTLHYHTNMDWIWWENEKNLI